MPPNIAYQSGIWYKYWIKPYLAKPQQYHEEPRHHGAREINSESQLCRPILPTQLCTPLQAASSTIKKYESADLVTYGRV